MLTDLVISLLNLRQLATFVGVYEEGSFSRAASRLNATQSGLSMQAQNLEAALGVRLFERSPRGVVPTYAGHCLYRRAVEVMRQLDEIAGEMKALNSGISGQIHIGLMPTFTRGVLSPALAAFIEKYSNVDIHISEGYSAALTEQVATGQLDFAIVPTAPKDVRVRASWLGSDREVLMTRAGGPIPHLVPVWLTQLPEMKYILPSQGNARRDRIDAFWELHHLKRTALVEMDAMIATLEFVASSDFATILPQTICLDDLDGSRRSLHPILDDGMTVDYAIIEPAKSELSPAARLFLDGLRQQYAQLREIWQQAIDQGLRDAGSHQDRRS